MLCSGLAALAWPSVTQRLQAPGSQAPRLPGSQAPRLPGSQAPHLVLEIMRDRQEERTTTCPEVITFDLPTELKYGWSHGIILTFCNSHSFQFSGVSQCRLRLSHTRPHHFDVALRNAADIGHHDEGSVVVLSSCL